MKIYRQLVRALASEFPDYKVSVRRVRHIADSAYGDCLKVGQNRFRVRISRSLDEDSAILNLMHEWAHVLNWPCPFGDHGPEWGVAYSRVYQVWERFR